jgi:glycogen operon protein
VNEFKLMVRELHKAGLEVILDVVFNHTAEGSEMGPTFSFRGIDNEVYYTLAKDRRYYQNFSGCGNTMNCGSPIVAKLIIDCLDYWVAEMHVDGFRFDLGSILGRDRNGVLLENPPTIERIAEEPILRNTKLIAEAWDAGGAYQVGWFPGGRWAEWNDRYRDEVRRFWRGDANSVRMLATRLSGSSDLYLRDGRKPFHSINFNTSHDGFTLADLVSYNEKHNLENGEDNRDGNNANYSRNNGFEGPVDNPSIIRQRERQVKNFWATLMLSQGTPMLLGGDEFARTQMGNNNAYCQDNEISWYDWNLAQKNAGILRFCKNIIAFRRRHVAFQRPEFYTGTGHAGTGAVYDATPDIAWYTPSLSALDWAHADKTIAMYINGTKAAVEADRDDNDFFVMFNSGEKAVLFSVVPAGKGKRWHLKIDTALPSPGDIIPPDEEPEIDIQAKYQVKARSCVVLIAK